MKKGMSYVDWIISMGLFIIVVIALFIFLRPGAQPVFEGKSLISVVETKFFENVSWKIKQTPIMVYTLTDLYPAAAGNHPAKITLDHPGPAQVNWSFSAVSQDAQFNISLSPLSVVINCNTAVCDTQPPKKQLSVVSYDNGAKDTFEINVDCVPHDNAYCHMEVGAVEETEGINIQKLQAMQSMQYDTVKQSWNFPVGKDFNITLIYLNATAQEQVLAPPQEPPLQSNVFVKEVNTWLLDKFGSRTPVKISMKVW